VDEWNRLFASLFSIFLAIALTFDRDKQHVAITLGLGGLYPAPNVVRAVLSPQGYSKEDLGFR
jgi:hypothetical protein